MKMVTFKNMAQNIGCQLTSSSTFKRQKVKRWQKLKKKDQTRLAQLYVWSYNQQVISLA